jgi:hypothetical protein
MWTLAVVLLSVARDRDSDGNTGNTGGDIRHPEIISDSLLPVSRLAPGSSILPGIEYFVVASSRWVWPILEDLHFLGLILIVASIGLLNLRILGFFKRLPVAPLHRFVPFGIAGVFINVVTGMLFFIGMPPFYSDNIDFQLKMLAIVIAGANLVLFYCSSAFRPLASVGPGENASLSARFVAAGSLFLWIAIIVMGRYMPFFEVLH